MGSEMCIRDSPTTRHRRAAPRKRAHTQGGLHDSTVALCDRRARRCPVHPGRSPRRRTQRRNSSAFITNALRPARDTTGQYGITEFRASVTIFIRRAAQQESRAGALDRTLQASRLVTLNNQVRVSALDAVIRTRTMSAPRDSPRHSDFSVRQAGLSVGAGVVVTGTSTLAIRSALLIGVRLWPGPTLNRR